MTPIQFPEQNAVIGEGQKQYQPLPAFINPSIESVPAIFCVGLDNADVLAILQNRKIWFQQLTFGGHFKPILVGAEPMVTGGQSEMDYQERRDSAVFAMTDEMVTMKGDPKALAQIAFVMGADNPDLAVFIGELLKLAKAKE